MKRALLLLIVILKFCIPGTAQKYTYNPGYFEADGYSSKYGIAPSRVRADTSAIPNRVDSVGVMIYWKEKNSVWIKTKLNGPGPLWEQITSGGNNPIDTVLDIAALQSYTGGSKLLLVKDTLRGGLFYKTTTGNNNGGTCFSGLGGIFWNRSNINGIYNAAWWGATGYGLTDETTVLQSFLNFLSSIKGGIGYMRRGTYMVNPDYNAGGSLYIRDSVRLILDPAAVIKSIPVSVSVYGIVRFVDAHGASIEGGTIIGDRLTHIGSTGESGIGIGVYRSDNISIRNIIIKNCWGDGIYVGGDVGSPSTKINIENVKCDSVRRNGLSLINITSGKVTNSYFTNSNGAPPQAGIDVEPNAGQFVDNVEFNNIHCSGNTGNGFVSTGTNITLSNSHLYNNQQRGFYTSSEKHHVINCYIYGNLMDGAYANNVNELSINNCNIYNNANNGVFLQNCNNDLKITGNIIHNNTQIGVLVSGPTTKRYSISENNIYNNTGGGITAGSRNGMIQNNSIYANSAVGIAATGNKLSVIGNNVYENSQTGIQINGDSSIYASNLINSNSQATNLTYRNVLLTGTASYNTIIGNVIKQGNLTNKPIYGITINSSTNTGNIVYINDNIGGGASGDLIDGGTNTIKWLDAPPLNAILTTGSTSSLGAQIKNLTLDSSLDIRGLANSILIRNGTATRWRFAGSGTESGGNVGSDLIINNRADDGSSIGTVARFYRATGNLRIGNTTADPSRKLYIEGGITALGDSINITNGTVSTYLGTVAGSTSGKVGTSTNHPLTFLSNNSEVFRITQSRILNFQNKSESNTYSPVIQLQNASLTRSAGIQLNNNSSSPSLAFWINGRGGGPSGDVMLDVMRLHPYGLVINDTLPVGAITAYDPGATGVSAGVAAIGKTQPGMVRALRNSVGGLPNVGGIQLGSYQFGVLSSTTLNAIPAACASITTQTSNAWASNTAVDVIFSTISNDGNPLAERMRLDSNGNVNATADVIARHYRSKGTTPTFTPNGATTSILGTGYSFTITGNDSYMHIVITTGTGITTSGTIGTINFNTAFSSAPASVWSPASVNALTNNVVGFNAGTGSGISVFSSAVLLPSTTYDYNIITGQ